MAGTLYLLPTIIADDTLPAALPPDVIHRARQLTRFYVEAAKTTRAFLKLLEHPKPIAELAIEEIGHEPDPAKIDAWLAPVAAGEDAAIVSESGCPGIADPGAQLVARAHELGIRVVPLVGPSSILLTLMASGLDGQRFAFHGYLPIHEAERRGAIEAFERESAAVSMTQLFIETPYRNQGLLECLVEVLRPQTRLTVATDVTGAAESIRTMTVAAWRETLQREDVEPLPKLPTVFAFLAPRGSIPRGTAPRNPGRQPQEHRSSHYKNHGTGKSFRPKRGTGR